MGFNKSIAYCLLLIAHCLLLIASCKKDKSTGPPLVFVLPDALYVYANANDVVTFQIDVEAKAGLSEFKVTSKIDNGQSFTKTETAVTLNSQINYSAIFEFSVPQEAAGSSVILTFNATDVNGATGTVPKRVIVSSLPIGPKFLVETAGHKMYSKNSVNAGAYNLETGMAVFFTPADSINSDLQDNPPSDTTDVLSLSWISPAGGKFVKFNTFDYANATDSSLFNAYSSGIALSKVDNIQIGDIILTKLGNTSGINYAAISITGINDPASSNLDFYLFSFKK